MSRKAMFPKEQRDRMPDHIRIKEELRQKHPAQRDGKLKVIKPELEGDQG